MNYISPLLLNFVVETVYVLELLYRAILLPFNQHLPSLWLRLEGVQCGRSLHNADESLEFVGNNTSILELSEVNMDGLGVLLATPCMPTLHPHYYMFFQDMHLG